MLNASFIPMIFQGQNISFLQANPPCQTRESFDFQRLSSLIALL